LRLNVLLDDLIRHIARTCSEIALSPQVSSPELPTQLAKLLQQFPTTASFDTLHQVAHRHLRGYRHQQMHMVNGYMSAQDIHLQRRTCLPNQFAQPNGYFAPQYRFPILGNPHHVIFQVIDRVGCFSIAHDRIVLRPPSLSNPSGSGGQPSPIVTD